MIIRLFQYNNIQFQAIFLITKTITESKYRGTVQHFTLFSGLIKICLSINYTFFHNPPFPTCWAFSRVQLAFEPSPRTISLLLPYYQPTSTMLMPGEYFPYAMAVPWKLYEIMMAHDWNQEIDKKVSRYGDFMRWIVPCLADAVVLGCAMA
jgi:hypothetical protein